MAGPPGLPEDVTGFRGALLRRLARDEGWLATTRRLGGVPRGLGPAETRAYVGEQVEMYRALARRLGPRVHELMPKTPKSQEKAR